MSHFPFANKRTLAPLLRVALFTTICWFFFTTCIAQEVALLQNLYTPSPQAGTIGYLSPIHAGTSFGVGFTTGNTAYSVDSILIEFWYAQYFTPLSDVQILSLGSAGSPFTASQPLYVYGQLGNPTASGVPTLFPTYTTFIQYTPASPIILQPNTSYVIGCTAPASTSGGTLRVVSDESLIYSGDMAPPPVNDRAPLYSTTGSGNNWTEAGGFDPVMELNATPVPDTISCFTFAALVFGSLGLVRRSFLQHKF